MIARQKAAAKIFIGWDTREVRAYQVAQDSIIRHTSIPLSITPVVLSRLELAGVIHRPRRRLKKGAPMVITNGQIERRRTTAAQAGTLWDDISGAPMSTEFAIARFATLLLAHEGWALFLDPDMVALGDVAELFALANDDYAVMCVQHGPLRSECEKMDGQPQLPYARKNWSSVMLFNCEHPANRGLTLEMLNSRPGRDLHRFCWLDDRWIGDLPAAWNWLVNVNPRPADAKLAHFTLGGPWLPGWKESLYDDLWLAAEKNLGP